MSLNNVTKGANFPKEFNVVIEIAANSSPIKYEVDKNSGVLFVDRFLGTAMHYPTNYGYIPETMSDDGDPVDVLVITPIPLSHGVVIACRPIGVLKMKDESGIDAKILAVPISKVTPLYDYVKNYTDISIFELNKIVHFFTHYKDLEAGKHVNIDQWYDVAEAEKEIINSI